MSESSGRTEPVPESVLPDIPWIPAALDEMRVTLSEKNADYKIGGEFSNFEFAAQVAGLTPAHVMIAQVGIKLGRLMGLLQSNKDPNNESVADTIKDLHGYAAILHAWSMRAEHVDAGE